MFSVLYYCIICINICIRKLILKSYICKKYVHLFLDVLYEGSDLTVIKVSRLNMGTYLCIANNGIPPNAVRKVMLHVHCKYNV